MQIRFGDFVFFITKYTGVRWLVKKVASWLGYEDCGCDDRRDKWNIEIKRDG